MKNILQHILWSFSRLILRKYRPEVIGITGSVGKTSTKEAVFAVLATTYNIRRNQKNYNNEIGVPLTIIGAEAGGRSLLRWVWVFFKATWLLCIRDRSYPDMLILELGADHPGDIKKLAALIKPTVAVVTEIAESHLEFFETVEGVAQEKGELVRAVPATGHVVLNYDNKFVHDLKDLTEASIHFFGLTTAADVYASAVQVAMDNTKPIGMQCVIHAGDATTTMVIPQIVGQHLVYPILAAVAVGMLYDLDLATINRGIQALMPPKGRMRLIDGIKKTIIIDDSYNSSPLAAKRAVEQLALMPTKNATYAVLADMLELGRSTAHLHYDLGVTVALHNVDYLITVGELSRDIVRGALATNMSKDRCFNFQDSVAAGQFLQKRIEPGDALLVKGSRGMHMELAVKELMAEPERADELVL